MINAFTVDVEDWYQTSDFRFDKSSWDQFEDRVAANTMELLELLGRYQVRGTFFILGCVAEKHPALVEEIAKRGHEIGSHGGWHQMINTMTPEEFRADLLYSKNVLEGITGKKVELFRAPSWSITPDRYQVLRILAEEGFLCDSSIQPFRTPLSGVTGAPVAPYTPVVDGERLPIIEFPPTVLKWAGTTIPFSGGFYMRAMPYAISSWALRQVNRTRPGMVYVHPWEIDLEQPRLKASPLVMLAHYHQLHTTKPKLERFLQEFRFAPLGEVIKDRSYPAVALVTPMRKGSATN